MRVRFNDDMSIAKIDKELEEIMVTYITGEAVSKEADKIKVNYYSRKDYDNEKLRNQDAATRLF